jgi:hypothetical protein
LASAADSLILHGFNVCRSIAQAVPCQPGSPDSIRFNRANFLVTTAFFIAPENSGIFFQQAGVESSMPTRAATSSSVSPYEIAPQICSVISEVRLVGRPPGCFGSSSLSIQAGTMPPEGQ